MTAVTRSDEGLSGTLLGLVDALLGEFRKGNPYMTKLYGKSDNACSYYRNFTAVSSL